MNKVNTVEFSLKETTSFHKKKHPSLSHHSPFYRVKRIDRVE